MKIYKNCRTLSMFRFYEILETKDYYYLVEDYDNVERTPELERKLDGIWTDLFKEYINLKDDRKIRSSFKKLALISKMETKLTICANLLKGLSLQTTKTGLLKYKKELSAWGYPINGNKSLTLEVERLTKQLKLLHSSINIKRSEYKKEYHSDLTKEKISIDAQIVNVEQTLQNVIDSNRVTVSKWIEYVKRAEVISKKYGKTRTN